MLKDDIAAFLGKYVDMSQRLFEEADAQFQAVSEVMRQYASQSGGTFSLSIDERYKDPRSAKIPYPFNKLPYPIPIHPDDPAFKVFTDNFWAKASVHRQFQSYGFDFDLYKMAIYIYKNSETSKETGPSYFAPLYGECSVKPKKLITLSILNTAYSTGTGKTGLGRLSGLRKAVASKLRPEDETEPLETYLCPFSSPALNEKFVLRCSSVQVGNNFANDAAFTSMLLKLPTIASFAVGLPTFSLKSNYAITVSAHPDKTVQQLEDLHQIMGRATILLEGAYVI